LGKNPGEETAQREGEMKDTPKPCPFCGNIDTVKCRSFEDGSGLVSCDHAGVCGPNPTIVHNRRNELTRCCSISSMSENPALEHWNQRPIEDALNAKIKNAVDDIDAVNKCLSVTSRIEMTKVLERIRFILTGEIKEVPHNAT